MKWVPLAAGAAVLVLLAIGFAVWWFLFRPPPTPAAPQNVVIDAATIPPLGPNDWTAVDVVHVTLSTSSPGVTIMYSAAGSLTLPTTPGSGSGSGSGSGASADFDLAPPGGSQTPQGTTTVTYFARAGSVDLASQTLTVNVDRSPPAISYTISPAPNGAGWNKTAARIDFACTAGPSGLDASGCPPPRTMSTEGVTRGSTATVTGNTGRSNSIPVPDIKIDMSPPTSQISALQVKPGAFPVFVSGTASDPGTLSGVGTVQVSLQNAARAYWSGSQWLQTEQWLTTDNIPSGWTTNQALPSFAQAVSTATSGTFSSCSKATDHAGNVQAEAGCISFTVTSNGGGPTDPFCLRNPQQCVKIEGRPAWQLVDPEIKVLTP